MIDNGAISYSKNKIFPYLVGLIEEKIPLGKGSVRNAKSKRANTVLNIIPKALNTVIEAPDIVLFDPAGMNELPDAIKLVKKMLIGTKSNFECSWVVI